MTKTKKIKIVEVGPRDGLQNESTVIKTKDKIKFIELLADAGLKEIEATSFVNPKNIPQMSDSKELFEILKNGPMYSKVSFPCLVPNKEGLKNALDVGVNHIAFFTATSNTFNKRNTNASIEESFDRFDEILSSIDTSKIRVRCYLSTVFGCPYEGEVDLDQILKVLEKINKMNVHEISLGDTIGAAVPKMVEKLIESIKDHFDLSKFAMHFHDTRGMALTNAYVSLVNGIEILDSSAGGVGGCPYAPGSTGNVATEDILYLCDSLGFESGVDMDKLIKASEFILSKIGKNGPSKYYQFYKDRV